MGGERERVLSDTVAGGGGWDCRTGVQMSGLQSEPRLLTSERTIEYVLPEQEE